MKSKRPWIGKAAWRRKYHRYLNSPEWRRKRDRIRRERVQCERCGGQRFLQVHHLTYERIFEEQDSDLQLLCRTCHRAKHPDKIWQSAKGK